MKLDLLIPTTPDFEPIRNLYSLHLQEMRSNTIRLPFIYPVSFRKQVFFVCKWPLHLKYHEHLLHTRFPEISFLFQRIRSNQRTSSIQNSSALSRIKASRNSSWDSPGGRSPIPTLLRTMLIHTCYASGWDHH